MVEDWRVLDAQTLNVTYFWGRTVVEDWRVLDPQTLNVTYFWSRTVVEDWRVLDPQTLNVTYFWSRTVVEDWRVLDPQTLNVTYFWSRTVVEDWRVLDPQTLLGDDLVLRGEVGVIVQSDAVFVRVAEEAAAVVQDWTHHSDGRNHTPVNSTGKQNGIKLPLRLR